jgi:TRAP-type transport system small permease protein
MSKTDRPGTSPTAVGEASRAFEDVAGSIDPDTAPQETGPAFLVRMAYGLGGCGLLAATVIDAVAVLGRHSGFHLLGSIELVQSAMVVMGCSAMVIATLTGHHASIQVVSRVLEHGKARQLARASALVCAAAFFALAAGSAWLAVDLWGGFEQTEVLHIPLRWLRALWVVAALIIAGRFLQGVLARNV